VLVEICREWEFKSEAEGMGRKCRICGMQGKRCEWDVDTSMMMYEYLVLVVGVE